jgi:hypothetical protein
VPDLVNKLDVPLMKYWRSFVSRDIAMIGVKLLAFVRLGHWPVPRMQLESLCHTHSIFCGLSVNFHAFLVPLSYCMFNWRYWSRGFSLLCFGHFSDRMTTQWCKQPKHISDQKFWISATISLNNYKRTMVRLHEIDQRT